MANYRVSRVREQLQRELGDIVGRLRDPRLGFVTVMDVELSNDLHYATMFVSVLGEEEAQREAVKALESALGHIRSELARRIRLRQAPEITVRYDDTSERAARVGALINEIPPLGDVSAVAEAGTVSGEDD
ncbi:MAG TPA: 30S ribosome-binding factor RbfA [Candidatus Latescibacteria bacterium]|jgi:ribosome-binding factor A|nr:ribosome-binding factor A [Gemmatimonadaceae bacterium]HJP30706.1 30S ribosome-binding factor RbfA [Candidatus Latescibacterota bacterium]|tara:strand:- start:139 stop:531 length:393 start_codon:yes stop_codon:yes gene_type:complete